MPGLKTKDLILLCLTLTNWQMLSIGGGRGGGQGDGWGLPGECWNKENRGGETESQTIAGDGQTGWP